MSLRRRCLVPLRSISFVTLSTGLLLLTFASPARAQATPSANPSHWGVRVSFVKGWQLPDQIKKIFEDQEGNEVSFSGDEYEIGVVRGSRLGGDWGVSFVHKPWDDGSGVIETSQDCFNAAQTNCRPRTETTLTKGMVVNGVEVHWFIRFVNIKERAQIGLNLAGGIGWPSGDVVKTTDTFQPTGFNQNGPTGFIPVHQVEVTKSKDEFLPYWPLGKIEGVASFIAAPQFKVQAAYGLNFPAISWRLMGVVLF